MNQEGTGSVWLPGLAVLQQRFAEGFLRWVVPSGVPIFMPKAKALQVQSPFAQSTAPIEANCAGEEDRETVKGYLYDWDLVKKMGSSIEDIISTVGKSRCNLQPSMSSDDGVKNNSDA